jgi:hypothetical protein
MFIQPNIIPGKLLEINDSLRKKMRQFIYNTSISEIIKIYMNKSHLNMFAGIIPLDEICYYEYMWWVSYYRCLKEVRSEKMRAIRIIAYKRRFPGTTSKEAFQWLIKR